jgi:AAA ATPase domain
MCKQFGPEGLTMRFLTSVRIADFRSIAQAEIDELSDITPVVGLNGSGKSNLMRALNLFFNGELEPGQALNLRRDFREPGRRKTLRIVIEADLDFAEFAELRPELEEALNQLAAGAKHLTVRKEWTLDPTTKLETVTAVSVGPVGDEPTLVPLDQLALITRLLNVIRFRYQPNHVHPSQILANEEQTVRRMLFDRLGKRRVLEDAVVREIAEVAGELMEPIQTAMAEITGEVASVELSTPETWQEVVWAFGMKLRGPQSQAFEAPMHGSGIQSILAYNILHAVDTSFSGSFGWRKGAIWALEEPESYLHAGLQEELARELVDDVTGQPLQILFTTHATSFLGTSSHGVVATLDGDGRTEFASVESRELFRNAYTSRISPFAHALHTGPPKPRLLVEGTSDRDLIMRAYTSGGLPNPYEILALSDLDEMLTGGDDVAEWLKYNGPALAARPETSPVYVLRDWESSPKDFNKIQKALNVHRTSKCVQWPKDLTNPDLSDSFVGIEKFLSTEFFEEFDNEFNIRLMTPLKSATESWQYDVTRKKLAEYKSDIHDELTRRNSSGDIRPLIDALSWLSGQLAALPPMV